MENKESFGIYIARKRKEANLTQKQFAEKLFVTESAVSKWERGLSYPDITLISDICSVLQISERELMTASEDTETRNYEKLAKRYLRLTKRTKYTLVALHVIPLIVCFICNLAIQHTLSWFFIVLTSLMVSASLLILPLFVKKHRALITLGGFTASLLILLLTCSLFVGGNWFLVTAISVLFGLSIIFLPFVLRSVYLPEPVSNHKTLLYFVCNTIFLFLLLWVCDWFTQGGWFLCFAVPVAAFSLILPWGMMAIIRYTPMNGFFKASACLTLTGVFSTFINTIIHTFLGEPQDFVFDLLHWNAATLDGNIKMVILISCLGLAVAFAIAGIIIAVRNATAKKELSH